MKKSGGIVMKNNEYSYGHIREHTSSAHWLIVTYENPHVRYRRLRKYDGRRKRE